MTWSGLDLASHCRADEERTRFLVEEIGASVKSGDTVLDAGAGSGVLALSAVDAGARRVIAVEQNDFVCDILRWSVSNAGVPIEVLQGNVADLDLPYVDVLVAEMIDVWLLEEDLVAAAILLAKRGIIDAQTKMIPHGYRFHAELGWCNWSTPGYRMKWPYYEWPHYSEAGWETPKFNTITPFYDIACVDIWDAARRGDPGLTMHLCVDSVIVPRLREVNALRLSGIVQLATKQIASCRAMNAPIVIPLACSSLTSWEEGVTISGLMSQGMRTLDVRTGEKSLIPWRAF